MRALPKTKNPQLVAENTPGHEILVKRRRLGQTDLKGGSGEAQGIFNYCHLRLQLPSQGLEKSGIFTVMKNGSYPESYFLMRRSKDGYISATGMYKAAFPFSSLEEEQVERKHHKALPSGNGDEIAGNVWISPEDALNLAEEYSIRPYIVALLDPAPIEIGPKDKISGSVTAPPKFVAPASDSKLFPPPEMPASTPVRSRAKRSVSPSKATAAAASPRKIASPRKRAPRAASVKAEDKVDKSSKALQEKVEPAVVANGTTTGDAEIRVAAQEIVEQTKDDSKIIKTTVTVSMPASHPDLTIPKSLDSVIEKAKDMIEEANKHPETTTTTTMSSTAGSKKGHKRKASTNLTKEEEKGLVDTTSEPAPKKQKTDLETRLMTERVRTRALVGLTATLAIGAIIPYFL